MSSAIEQYKTIAFQANIQNINAYKVIQALMNNVLDKITVAKFSMQENNIAVKGLNISLAITTIDALQASLDKEQGGEIADNLFKLYTYMGEKLLLANIENNVALLDEIGYLMTTIKQGWDGIENQAMQILQEKNKVAE